VLRALLAGGLCAFAACSSDPMLPQAGAPEPRDAGADGPVDPFVPLIAADWDVGPGEERYVCTAHRISEPLHVSAFRQVAAPGTHHVVLYVTEAADLPEGPIPCPPPEQQLRVAYVGGLGTPAFELPAPATLELAAGQTLVLSLHLVNPTDAPLAGRSAVEIAPGEGAGRPVGILLAGEDTGGRPIGPGEVTEVIGCRVAAPTTVLAALPHMHGLGRRMVALAWHQDGRSSPLFDRAFTPDEQRIAAVATPVELATGDLIAVQCTWNNPGAETVLIGPRASDEMCVAILFVSPPPPFSAGTCRR
jgi:hypothetical protein